MVKRRGWFSTIWPWLFIGLSVLIMAALTLAYAGPAACTELALEGERIECYLHVIAVQQAEPAGQAAEWLPPVVVLAMGALGWALGRGLG